MAKEDFCFTYYDGDAARDKAHLSRLERGAYDDLISAQRKRGHLSLDDIKKVLSKDFECCWPALEWILKKDEAGKYFIDWLEMSLVKMRKHSEKQKQNVTKRYQRPTKDLPNSTLVVPLEDGNGNEYGNSSLGEGSEGEQIVPAMLQQFQSEFPKYFIHKNDDFPALRSIAEKIQKEQKLSYSITENADKIRRRWGELIQHVKGDKHFVKYSLSQINKHFQSIIQSSSNASVQKPTRKTFTDFARERIAGRAESD